VVLTVLFCGFVCAQTKFQETRSFSTGLSTAASAGKLLESVLGGMSGAPIGADSKKILSGHSSTSHSPGVVYDLVASTQPVTEGQVRVSWTSVGRDGFRGTATAVVVKIATFPVTYANYDSITSSLTLVGLSTGTIDISTYSHLVPGPQYYTALRVRDSAGIYGRLSSASTFYTSAIAPDPVTSLTVQSSTSGAITLAWTMTGDDATSGAFNPGFLRIDYSTDPAHAFSSSTYATQLTTSAAALTPEFYGFSALTGNVTYYAAVFLGDDVTVYSGLGTIAQIITMAYPPTPAGFSDMTLSRFSVNYAADNSAGTQYYVQISTSVNFSSATSSGWLTTSSATFSGLVLDTPYYARGKARNASGIETIYADLGSITLSLNVPRPRAPAAYGSLSDANFTISWDQVVSDIYGAAISIRSYEVYRSTSLSADASLVATVSSSAFSYSETVSGVGWYYVKAIDMSGFRSDASMWLRNSGGLDRIVGDDSRAAVDLAPELTSALRGKGLFPKLARQAQYESGLTLSSYKLYFLDVSNNEQGNLDFPSDVKLTMPASRTGTVNISANYSIYDCAVYYYNGVEDVKIGGSVDPVSGTISVVTRKSGVFKVKRVLRSGTFAIIQTVPKKIFTPNGDGIWDEFNIIYENPGGVEIDDAKVYDLGGRAVADLKIGSYNTEASLAWDGKRKNGDNAEAGIYIYQFKAGDKYYNGTAVLAR